jgi:hypothetical protein
MKSKWVEYNGKQIFFQDYSNFFFNEQAVKKELTEAQDLVMKEPANSLLVLTNMSNTEVTLNLMPIFNEASKVTRPYIRKTAVLGVSGVKRTLGDLLSKITGQQLMYFNNEVEAKAWLTKE